MDNGKKVPAGFREYEDGKHRRYELLFAVNGGAFALATFLEDKKLSLRHLDLTEISIGMILFTVVMFVDIFIFGHKMRQFMGPKNPDSLEVFAWQGKAVLSALGILICAGWTLAMWK